ncbi:alpha/beta hydrolase fold domain-containing protein [Nonomuraea sp. NPDC050328]|uniref:alpha/beta hydrolase fold domain-containing protein n=1 Tax=Nonomuraea sp. NPDC050328 TaxID=3364361 RepID=UPI00379EE06C
MPQKLDDCHRTTSSQQFSAARGAIDSWVRETNVYAWNAILGEGHEEREVSIYESPARADDLRGLPQTFIDVGGCEVFRDAAIAYASTLLAGGVSTELHVWPGGYTATRISRPRRRSRSGRVRREPSGSSGSSQPVVHARNPAARTAGRASG